MIRILVCLLSVFLLSCKTAVFKKDFHRDYEKKLLNAGLEKTALGRKWFDVSAMALAQPARIALPHKEIGYFSSEKPRAVGLSFSAKRGQKLFFQIDKTPASNLILYVDLWQRNQDKPSLLFSLDTSKSSFEFEVEKDQELVLRVHQNFLKVVIIPFRFPLALRLVSRSQERLAILGVFGAISGMPGQEVMKE